MLWTATTVIRNTTRAKFGTRDVELRRFGAFDVQLLERGEDVGLTFNVEALTLELASAEANSILDKVGLVTDIVEIGPVRLPKVTPE